MNKNHFLNVGAMRPGKSAFSLTHSKSFDCDIGQLIPLFCEEMYPGDIFDIGFELVVRAQPLVAPIMHEINAYIDVFFSPYRLLWNAKTREDLSESGDWIDFITGGEDGLNSDTLPKWHPATNPDVSKYSIWDYFGHPVLSSPPTADSVRPMDFPLRAYIKAWNEYYRDEDLQDEVDLDKYDLGSPLNCCWEKDYFTTALESQQRGVAMAFPISGTVNAVWGTDSSSNQDTMYYDHINDVPYIGGTKGILENNEVDLSGAATFDISDLRLYSRLQEWMERNMAAGVRYNEFLNVHYSKSPTDKTLDRTEYVGGIRQSVIISEVLQTESSDASTPQGTMAGHGLSADSQYIGKYRCEEIGCLIAILRIMPRTVYTQGYDRQWIKTNKEDFYFPEFAHLSEQPVYQMELFADGNPVNDLTVFGYQGVYNWMRSRRSIVCGDLRDTLDHWNLSRQFGSAPVLDDEFVECNGGISSMKRIFSVPSVPGFIVHCLNKIKCLRPIPVIPIPRT